MPPARGQREGQGGPRSAGQGVASGTGRWMLPFPRRSTGAAAPSFSCVPGLAGFHAAVIARSGGFFCLRLWLEVVEERDMSAQNLMPYQRRVIDEKAELDERLTKLVAFIEGSPVFSGLDADEQWRLGRQREAMDGYSRILGERIAAFG